MVESLNALFRKWRDFTQTNAMREMLRNWVFTLSNKTISIKHTFDAYSIRWRCSGEVKCPLYRTFETRSRLFTIKIEFLSFLRWTTMRKQKVSKVNRLLLLTYHERFRYLCKQSRNLSCEVTAESQEHSLTVVCTYV